MSDNTLSIGAVVDVEQLKTGFDESRATVKDAVSNMAVSFQELSAKTASAMRGISEDVRTAAQHVSAESLHVAEATRAQAAAYADLRRANIIVKDSNIDAAQSTALLAAVQEKVAATSKAVADAQKEAAAVAAETAEEQNISSNSIIAGFQRMALAARESFGEVQEKMVSTAEKAEISAEGIGGAFAGFGELLGLGLVGGFAAHFLDQLAEVNVRLGDLHDKTDINIQSLAGLQQIAKQMGLGFQPIEMGLVRMQRGMVQARNGLVEYKRAFYELGISMQEVKSLTPEQMLYRVAKALHDTGSQATRSDAALELFGRGGATLIPILQEQGAQLEANMKKEGEFTKITDQSVNSARQWTRATAELAAEFRALLLPVLNHIVPVIESVKLAFESVAAVIVVALSSIGAVIANLVVGLGGVAKVAWDAAHLNYRAMIADTEATGNRIKEQWKNVGKDISGAMKLLADDYNGIHWNAPQIEHAIPPTPNDLSDYSIMPKGRGRHARGAKEKHEKAAKALEPDDNATASLFEATQAFEAANQQQVRSAQSTAAQTLEAYRQARDEEVRMAQEKYQDLAQESANEVSLGKRSADSRTALLRNASNDEYAIQLQAVQAKEAVDMSNAARFRADLNKELQLYRQHMRQMQQLDHQDAAEKLRVTTQLYQGIGNNFTKLMQEMIASNRKMSLSLTSEWKGLTANFTANILKMAEQYLIGLALQKAGQKSAILADAKTAAANTYAAVSAIPVVGPFLAPEAAAAAFAAVVAFQSFAKGGVVSGQPGKEIPVLAQAGERVLTPSQTHKFDSMVNGGGASARQGDMHLHYSPQVNAYDRTGMRSTLHSHSDDILDIVREGYRRGAFA